ncbi:gustatory receptor for sugar taste 64b-like isoform X1 [Phlebotomus papatasi]|uniref:gustatory receptor for sugar taste 64b-like isoform X1 n=1 Tax=Phlebotomus papatasi TaxID=29031 RepID=UPI00248347F3|nr:gustatory receptor for sugar taste 64b-like isoform X1 [Phlebotomus papatasi]XP_055696746.1 gustatory receptor for sugar taste 64b-like isoform X1 [Phlebotomus papatasi]
MENQQRTKILLNSSEDTFHRAAGIILQIGQIFAIFPVSGILNKNSNKLRFRWISIGVLYYFLFFCFQILNFLLSLRRLVKVGMSFGAFATVFFYFVTLSGGLIIFQMAKKWHRIVKRIEQTEKIFLHPPYRQIGRTLRWKVQSVTLFLLTGAVLEHVMYFVAKFFNAKIQIERCNLQIPIYEHYLKTERRHIFAVIPYKTSLAIFLEWANISSTICWSYFDIFFTLFTSSMAYRFRQITDRMKRARFKTMPDSFWIELRSNFTHLTSLLNYLDRELSNLIILICGSNLYFICQQLFNSFGMTSDSEQLNTIYFWFSLLFVICRTLTTLFFAASVNEAAKEPYQILKTLPYTSWTVEIQRFSDQLISEVIGFSGKRFFYITRTLILALIGTIVTYELVLLDHIAEAPEVIQRSCHIAYIETVLPTNLTI